MHTTCPQSFKKKKKKPTGEIGRASKAKTLHKLKAVWIGERPLGRKTKQKNKTKMNKSHRAQGERNGHGQKGSGGEREIPRAAAGWPVFSLRPHERCDCLPTSPRQESSPSGGQRPLYLPGRRGETQGRLCQILRRSRRLGARGVGGGMRCKKKRSCFSICVINT